MTPPRLIASAHREFRGRVERVAARILRDDEEARDIASDTFLAMIERGPREHDAALSWLLTTSRRRALNRVRDRARAEKRAIRAAEPDVPSLDPPDERALGVLRSALTKIGERDRLALQMRYVNEESVETVAAALGVTPSVARVIVHRATRRLRRETVRLLAEHHRVPMECADELAKRAEAGHAVAHPGCGSCAAVADEVGALTASGIIPLASMSVLRRITDAITRASSNMPLPRVPSLGGRVTEVAAALIVTGAMALPSAAAPAASIAAARTPRISNAESHAKGAASLASGNLAPAARRARSTGGRISSDVQEDASNDPTLYVTAPAKAPQVKVVGMRLSIADTVTNSLGPGLDITRFETVTTAGRRGHANGLLYRIQLAGKPDPSATYGVSFAIRNTACTGHVEFQPAQTRFNGATSYFSLSCPQESSASNPPKSDQETYWSSDLQPSSGENWIDFAIPFSALPNGARSFLKPGIKLSGVYAWSSRGFECDRAPEYDSHKDGLDYTIAS